MADDLRYWLGLSLVRGLGAARMQSLLRYFGDLEAAWKSSAAHLRAAGLPKSVTEHLLYLRSRVDLDRELERLRELDVQVITWDSPEYRSLLKAIDHPPPVLYIKGELLPCDEWAVAIVGTRNATSYGRELARQLAGDLARAGVTIVSGLALGIDAVAHRAALEAGGRTIAVQACGLDIVYPWRHRELARRIETAGALVSDYAIGVKPEPSNFPPRNRIISGLSLGTIVVEADLKSGALITLQFALEQGRETFAVPGSVFQRASRGTNAAIQRGEAKLITCAQDVLEELNLGRLSEQQEARSILPETETERVIVSLLGRESLHVDEIVRRSQLSTADVTSALTLMELKGMVRRVENMTYALVY